MHNWSEANVERKDVSGTGLVDGRPACRDTARDTGGTRGNPGVLQGPGDIPASDFQRFRGWYSKGIILHFL